MEEKEEKIVTSVVDFATLDDATKKALQDKFIEHRNQIFKCEARRQKAQEEVAKAREEMKLHAAACNTMVELYGDLQLQPDNAKTDE